jgi:hypothetical protein
MTDRIQGESGIGRARQQAEYWRAQDSEKGFRFWSEVASEVERRAGASAKEPMSK